MPGMESLRSSLLMPSFSSSRASAPKSESGATSNDSVVQRSTVAFVDLDGELADLGGEEGAVFFALGEHEPHHLGVIVDEARQVGRLEGGVSDASWLDHGGSPLCRFHNPRRRLIQSSPPR